MSGGRLIDISDPGGRPAPPKNRRLRRSVTEISVCRDGSTDDRANRAGYLEPALLDVPTSDA
jgi:hypothetical protein